MEEALVQSDQTKRRSRFLTRLLMAAPLLLFLSANALLFVFCFILHFGHAVKAVYAFNTLIMPVVFLLAAALLKWGLRNPGATPWRQRIAVLWMLTGIAAFGVRVYATHIEPNNLQIREVAIGSTKLNEPLTILHISDIQSGGIGAYERRVFEKIAALEPDLILHTGDVLQPIPPRTYESELPKVAALFKTLDAPLGMYMVQGDTCRPIYDAEPEETGGIAYLRNEDAAITRENDLIRIYGMDLAASAHGIPARGTVDDWLKTAPEAFNIVLGHRPDYILKMKELSIDLCLAGHTHGGQIRVPFWGPPIIFSKIPRKWARGFHQIGNTRLNVSAGIGAEHAGSLPSIRFNCPPEMTLIRIVPVG